MLRREEEKNRWRKHNRKHPKSGENRGRGKLMKHQCTASQMQRNPTQVFIQNKSNHAIPHCQMQLISIYSRNKSSTRAKRKEEINRWRKIQYATSKIQRRPTLNHAKTWVLATPGFKVQERHLYRFRRSHCREGRRGRHWKDGSLRHGVPLPAKLGRRQLRRGEASAVKGERERAAPDEHLHRSTSKGEEGEGVATPRSGGAEEGRSVLALAAGAFYTLSSTDEQI